jgi:dTDP-glucose pyrophosphorylase
MVSVTKPLTIVATTIRDAVRAIEEGRRGIAVVVDDQDILIGTVTDGDIRRSILAGHGLDSAIEKAMNKNPITAPMGSSESLLTDLLVKHSLEALPLINQQGHFVEIVHIRELKPETTGGGGEGFAAAVIMAGGEGRRLQPLTDNKPKPLIEVGGMPMIERQVRDLVRAGVPHIYISVNYLGHMIEEYFGNGSRFDTKITYLHEKEKMGTAGALSLLPKPPKAPILVMNGDVLTNPSFKNLFLYHNNQNSILTIAATEYQIEIPYGVLKTDGARVTGISEKPSQRFLCNAGVYVLSPEALELMPTKVPCDMPDLVNAALEKFHAVCVFPMHEYWADVGNARDLERAEQEIGQLENSDG